MAAKVLMVHMVLQVFEFSRNRRDELSLSESKSRVSVPALSMRPSASGGVGVMGTHLFYGSIWAYKDSRLVVRKRGPWYGL